MIIHGIVCSYMQCLVFRYQNIKLFSCCTMAYLAFLYTIHARKVSVQLHVVYDQIHEMSTADFIDKPVYQLLIRYALISMEYFLDNSQPWQQQKAKCQHRHLVTIYRETFNLVNLEQSCQTKNHSILKFLIQTPLLNLLSVQ